MSAEVLRSRFRFYVNAEDPRPVEWPIKHPYWVTGYADDMKYAVIVAYADNVAEVRRLWPDAIEIDDQGQTKGYFFNERFPKPEWWIV